MQQLLGQKIDEILRYPCFNELNKVNKTILTKIDTQNKKIKNSHI